MKKRDERNNEAAKEKAAQAAEDQAATDTPIPEQADGEAAPAAEDGVETEQATIRAELAEQQEIFLRLAAEYDNYRKRTTKEKESLWLEARAQTAVAFLPVYDNLERAVRQQTEDAAYAKGVQMTFDQLKETFTKLGIEEIPALGEAFDPALHNAVMHIERDDLGAGIIAEVYQVGFRAGEKIIRHSVVVVAN